MLFNIRSIVCKLLSFANNRTVSLFVIVLMFFSINPMIVKNIKVFEKNIEVFVDENSIKNKLLPFNLQSFSLQIYI